MEIKNKTVLVTGAAKRVGREIALAFARRGAHIVLHYNTSKADAEKTAGEIRSAGVTCRLVQADLTDVRQIMRLVSELDAAAVSVDILINSASLYYPTPLESVSEADWDRLVGSNLKGPFFLSRELGKRMFDRGEGKILNIADWSAFRPYRDFAPYCAAKGGLVTFTKSLARELAPRVISNAVAPGPVLIPPGMDEKEKESIAKLTALGRWGSPQDVANALLFLAENDYINGMVLVVDGGRSIV